MNIIETPILIVGGGPVGLAAALQLSRLQVNSLLIEKHPSTTDHPKARGVNIRSMELMRLWGLESALRLHELPVEAKRFVWTPSLQSKEFISVEKKDDQTSHAATYSGLVSQDWVESELYNSVKQSDYCKINFNTELLSFEQKGDGVIVTARDRESDAEITIKCRYLIAADGAHSPIRDSLGIKMLGQDNLGDFCNIYCEADLSKYMHDKKCAVLAFTDKERMCVVLSVDGSKKWIFSVRYFEEYGQSKQDFTEEYCVARVKEIINDPEIEVSLINRKFWQMAALNAASYQAENIFLAGDAAHRIPPTGGFGMNLGIQDAHNLAWKLAYVVNGWAEPELLVSYQQERSPITDAVLGWSSINAKRITEVYTALFEDDWKTAEKLIYEQESHLNSLGLDIGFIYSAGAIDTSEQVNREFDTSNYQPNTIPGSRAPCIKLQNQSSMILTNDLFEKNFVLLTADTSEKWRSAITRLNKYLPFDVLCYTVGESGDYNDINNDFLEKYQLSEQGAVLVRPDGHVAWRSQFYNDEADAKLRNNLEVIFSQ